jgi:hypothetical protein
MIRAKLFRGLRTGTMHMGSLYDDERLKLAAEAVCAYCDAAGPLTVDHLLPRISGGTDDGHNLVRACRSCNSSKGRRDLLLWYADRGAFPRLLVLRRYLKLMATYFEQAGLLDAHLDDGRLQNLPFDLSRLPIEFPSLTSLRL